MRCIPAVILGLFLLTSLGAALRAEEENAETEVSAIKEIEYFKTFLGQDPPRVVATGRIHIAQGDAELVVEDGGVVFWVDAEEWRKLWRGDAPKTPDGLFGGTIREMYAEGTVTLRRGGQLIRAERLYANFIEHRAVIIRGEFLARIGEKGTAPRVPLLVRAERIVQTTRNEIVSERASVTSDLYAEPHHELIVDDFVLRRRGRKYSFTGDSLTIKYEGLPVLWVPWVSASSTSGTDPLRDIDVGASSRYGYFLGVDLGYRLYTDEEEAEDPWGDISFYPVFRSERGIGLGGAFDYEGEGFWAETDAFYQSDRADEDKVLEEPVPRENRGRFRWQHYHEISRDLWGKRLHATGELAWHSDGQYLSEYETNEFKEDKAQENVGYLSWAGDSVGTSLTYKWWANDHETQTTYKPRAMVDVFRLPVATDLLGTGMDVLTSAEGDFSQIFRAAPEGSGERGTTTSRVMLRGRVDAPFTLGPVRVLPTGGAGYTMYGGHQNAERLDLHAAVRGAMDFWRVFPDVRSDWFDLNGLRHAIDLSAGYANRFRVTTGSDEIVVQDSSDLVDAIETVDLRMRHRFETKRAGEVVTFLEFEIRSLYFPTGFDARPAPFGAREEFQQGMGSQLVPEEELWRSIARHGWGPLLGELKAQILGNLFFAGDVWYDVETGNFETYSEGLRYETPKLSFLLGHRAIHDDSNIVTGWIDTELTERWSFRFGHQQNLRSRQGLATSLNIRRRLPDFIVDVSFRYNQKRNTTSFNIAIEPAALFDRRRARKADQFLDFERMAWYR
ncbi:MAG: hypothetical protein ABFS86_15665 [Planctomycetota bacterium]